MSCKHMHKICNIDTVDGVNQLTVTNANGVENKDKFCLVVNQCTKNLSGTVTIKINGTFIPVYNKYSLNLQISDILAYKIYHGYYVGDYVIINAPCESCNCSCGC